MRLSPTFRSLLVLSFLPGGPALAMGYCEGLEISTDPTAWSAKTRELLVTGSLQWCELNDDEEEVRGVWNFAHLMNSEGKTTRSFLSATTDRARKAFAERTGATQVEGMDALKTYRAANAFVGLEHLQRAKGHHCVAGLKSARSQKKDQGFDLASVRLGITRAGAGLHSQEVGTCAHGHEPTVRLVHLPQSRELLAWITLPQCDAGFTAPGEEAACDLRDEHRLVLLKGQPWISSCFDPVKADPKARRR